ncbi:MAG TPA: accessory factor UbiK family protein [Gammaproteobacteria bacterium]
MNSSVIDELTKRLSGALPPGASVLKEDMEKNIRSVLHAAFSKMDLVTREEFEVQAQVLQRSRQKLEALEKQLAELESRLSR